MMSRLSFRPACVALALALSPFMAGCDAAPNDPYAAAQAAVADGKPRSALDLVATAIDQDPGNASYRLLAGDIAMSLGLPDRAITEFEAVSADAPEASLAKAKLAEAQVAGNYMQAAGETVASLTMDNPFAYVAAIAFNLAQGDAAKAFTLLDAGLAKYPDNHRLITVDAERLWSQAKRDEALARLEPVLSARPVVAQAHLFAGQLHLGERSPQKATEAFEHVLSAMPNNQTAMLALAAIARDKGDEKAAVNWINKANDAGSPHPVGLLFAAQMAYDAGEIDRAFELVERAPPAFAEQPEFARLRGLVDAARNQHAMAALALQEYVKDTGGDPLTRRVLANSLAETGEFEAAWSAIKPTVNHPQTDGATLVLALQLAQKTGKSDSEIRKAIARKQAAPSLAKPMREAGKAIRAGDWAKADGIYAPLLSGAGKDDPMLLNNAAAVKTRLGKHKAAVRLARRALDEAPDSPEIMDTLGWALWKEGVSVDEARTMLTRAREGAPSNRTINEHWAIAHAK